MTEIEKATLKAYLAKPDAVTYEHNGATYTLAQWIEFRDDAAVAKILSDPEVGAALGKTMQRAQVPAAEVKAEIASSAEFPSMPSSVMEKLSWFISSDPFPMAEQKMRDGVAGILQAFDDARSKFLSLASRPASIAESLIGRNVFVDDVSEALN